MPDPLPDDFRAHKVKVTAATNNIYKLFATNYLPASQLAAEYSVPDLFRYCSDISVQVDKAGFGPSNLLLSVFSSVVQETDKTHWAILGIMGFDRLSKYPMTTTRLLDTFEQVDLAKPTSRELFKMDGALHGRFTFFQSKSVMSYGPGDTLDLDGLGKNTLNALGSTFQQDYSAQRGFFHLALPLDESQEWPMNEVVGIYLLMYYLSRLVRYQPYVLEELLSTREAWLIESLVRYCPLTFLRGVVSWIVNEDHFITLRSGSQGLG
jgi:YaaC-like Protein